MSVDIIKTKFEVVWRDQKYLMEWFDDTDFERLQNVIQVYGFVFNDNRELCLVDCNKGFWSLPGGGVEEYDKTYEGTLIREVNEEADLDLKNIQRIGYFRVTPKDKDSKKKEQVLLRFFARVDKIKEQTIDPAENTIAIRKFIDPKDFNKYIHWKEPKECKNFQLNKALDILKKFD